MVHLFSLLLWCLVAWASLVSAREVKVRAELTWDPRSPDGFMRNITLINGQFPGPRLEIEQDDEVFFLVENRMPFDTTIHFHGELPSLSERYMLGNGKWLTRSFVGIEQQNTPWSDGVPGVTQRAIKPG
jgi:FtsP/CotA-like multicopper oxidase with cupredoxin domain